jgi:hypothetical protein
VCYRQNLSGCSSISNFRSLRLAAIPAKRSIRHYELTAAIRDVCTPNKLDRRHKRPLSLICPIWFAAAAKGRFPPILWKNNVLLAQK